MLRLVRAIQVLEEIGTPAARTILEKLGERTGSARVAAEASAATRRLLHAR